MFLDTERICLPTTKSACENTQLKMYLQSAKKSKLPSQHVFGRGKQNPAGDAFEMEK